MNEARCRECRAAGEKLFTKGEKCLSPKCALTRRSYAPGQGGARKVRRKVSEYGTQLREKQKAKDYYNISERQFKNYFAKAAKSGEATGEELLRLLETRLDNVVYRMGFARSTAEARQMVGHGFINLNARKATIPSILVKPKDKISLAKDREIYEVEAPTWISVNKSKKTGEIINLPTKEDLGDRFNEQLIVEYYSR